MARLTRRHLHAPQLRGGLALRPLPSGARLGRWAVAGVLLGGLVTLVQQWPAAWLARAVHSATDGRLQLADARGTLWSGSALPVLTGGAGSRDAAVLPARLHWRLSAGLNGLQLALQQDCCMPAGVTLAVHPAWGRSTLEVQPVSGDTVGTWPAAWLEGLGAPWNTLKPAGQLRLSARGLALRQQAGGWQLDGQAELTLFDAASRLSPLDPLGSYQFTLAGQPGGARLDMRTLDGALLISGQGEWHARGVRFRGEAHAAPGQEAALNNLLNIIGRRQGAQTVISIG